MNVIDYFFWLFEDMKGRAALVWYIIFFVCLLKSYKYIKNNSVGRNIKTSDKTKDKELTEKGDTQKFEELKKKLYARKETKQLLIGSSISFISIALLIISDIINNFTNSDTLHPFESFLLFVFIVSACISVFLFFKEISLYLFDIAITGNSNYKTKKTIKMIKGIYYILMFYWGGVFFIFSGERIKKPLYHSWKRILGDGVTGFLHLSYFLLLFATILLLFTLLSIVFSYDLKAEKISERLKFIAFNYLQIVLLLTGLVMCSAILFGDFQGVLTEITIKGFLNCLYTVFLSLQDISIVYNEAVSVYGKIVLTICSFCNLLFIGMFVGTFLERN